MTKTNSNTKAFTLIELLIVIVIIGILAVALIPRLTGAQASARDAARIAGVQQVATAVSQSLAEKGSYTNTGTLITDGYLSSYPTDPKGASYGSFTVNTAGSGYTICADVERDVKGNSADANGTGTLSSGSFYCQISR